MEAYAHFFQPISQLLLHNTNYDDDDEPIEPKRPWEYWHPFVNISIVHNECSIACPRELAIELFAPVIAGLKPELQKGVTISKEDYSVIVIGGEGLEAGQRVLDLSSPLALAKM
jgi:cellobiose dehydrogenase (acceptor)